MSVGHCTSFLRKISPKEVKNGTNFPFANEKFMKKIHERVRTLV